jgi:hypothetical protein
MPDFAATAKCGCGNAGAVLVVVRQKAVLFLKKKNQKNFCPFGPVRRRRAGLCVEACEWAKVFCFFISKKKTRASTSLPPAPPTLKSAMAAKHRIGTRPDSQLVQAHTAIHRHSGSCKTPTTLRREG